MSVSAVGDKAALQAGVDAVTSEAGGAVAVAIIRPSDVPGLIGDAIAGSDEAAMLLRMVSDTDRRVKAAPVRARLLCVSCPREIQRGYAVVAAIPAKGSPHQAVALAVCPRCGPDRKTIAARANEGFSRIWPAWRPIAITHPEGGRA